MRIFAHLGDKTGIGSLWNFTYGYRGPRRNHPCKIWWQSVQGFWGSGGRISHFSIDFRCRLYNTYWHYHARVWYWLNVWCVCCLNRSHGESIVYKICTRAPWHTAKLSTNIVQSAGYMHENKHKGRIWADWPRVLAVTSRLGDLTCHDTSHWHPSLVQTGRWCEQTKHSQTHPRFHWQSCW